MVHINSEYATWRWNHCDSSRGRNFTLGLITLRMFRHIGKRIIAPSTDKANPAPRDIHTENVRVFKPASFSFDSCKYLLQCQHRAKWPEEVSHHPKANNPTWKPWKRKLKINLVPLVWALIKVQNSCIVPISNSFYLVVVLK